MSIRQGSTAPKKKALKTQYIGPERRIWTGKRSRLGIMRTRKVTYKENKGRAFQEGAVVAIVKVGNEVT